VLELSKFNKGPMMGRVGEKIFRIGKFLAEDQPGGQR